jgi:hypothetical protein
MKRASNWPAFYFAENEVVFMRKIVSVFLLIVAIVGAAALSACSKEGGSTVPLGEAPSGSMDVSATGSESESPSVGGDATPPAETTPAAEPRQTTDPSLSLNLTADIYIPNDTLDGLKEEKWEIEVGGTKMQQHIIEKVFLEPMQKSLPKSVSVQSLAIRNDTLFIDFSKEMKGFAFQDPAKEKLVVGALLQSLLNSSKEFMDVQFLLDGERAERLFGTFDTYNPLVSL